MHPSLPEASLFSAVSIFHPVPADTMSGSIAALLALLGALLVSSAAYSFETAAAQQSKETNVLQQLLANREKVRDPSDRLQPALRAEKRAHLSEDEREIMTKQIMQAISEVMNSKCMSDRDYHGWVDFGRRDVA